RRPARSGSPPAASHASPDEGFSQPEEPNRSLAPAAVRVRPELADRLVQEVGDELPGHRLNQLALPGVEARQAAQQPLDPRPPPRLATVPQREQRVQRAPAAQPAEVLVDAVLDHLLGLPHPTAFRGPAL